MSSSQISEEVRARVREQARNQLQLWSEESGFQWVGIHQRMINGYSPLY